MNTIYPPAYDWPCVATGIRRLKPAWTYEAIARVMRAGGRPARCGGFMVIDGGKA